MHGDPEDDLDYYWSGISGACPDNGSLRFDLPTLYDPGLVYVIVKRVTAQNE